eukprot:1195543-Prorocentrum_minimum.AAC.4
MLILVTIRGMLRMLLCVDVWRRLPRACPATINCRPSAVCGTWRACAPTTRLSQMPEGLQDFCVHYVARVEGTVAVHGWDVVSQFGGISYT